MISVSVVKWDDAPWARLPCSEADNPLTHLYFFSYSNNDCSQPVEVDYYADEPSEWHDPNMCAYCGNANHDDGIVDEEPVPVFHIVLPVCPTCREQGAKELVRGGKADNKKLFEQLGRKEARKAADARKSKQDDKQH
eukprot:jgi/Tetstr1/430958/TSEL_020713.t1